MGLCASSENVTPEEAQRRKLERDRSKALENTLTQDHSTDQAINKLLLLGAGESGQSTTQTAGGTASDSNRIEPVDGGREKEVDANTDGDEGAPRRRRLPCQASMAGFVCGCSTP